VGKGVLGMKKIIIWGYLLVVSTILFSQELTLHNNNYDRELYSGNSIYLYATNENSIAQQVENNNYNLFYRNIEELKLSMRADYYLTAILDDQINPDLFLYYHVYTSTSHGLGLEELIDSCNVTYLGVHTNIADLQNFYGIEISDSIFDHPSGFLHFTVNNDSTFQLQFYEYKMYRPRFGGGQYTSIGAGYDIFEVNFAASEINISEDITEKPILRIRNENEYNRKGSWVYFTLIQDSTAPSGIQLGSISVDPYDINTQYIIIENNRIIFSNPKTGYLPDLEISMNPEDLSDTGSGFKGYLVNNSDSIETDNNFKRSLNTLGDELVLRAVDNVENISTESISYEVIQDLTPPSATFHLDQLELNQSTDGTWQLKLSVGDSVENVVQISDTGAGLLESSFQAELIDEDDIVVSSFSSPIDGICYANFSSIPPGEERFIRISSMKDRVQNRIVYSDDPNNLKSSSFALPIFPSVDKDASQLSSTTVCHLLLTTEKDMTSQSGSLNLQLGSNSYPLGDISDFVWVQKSGYYQAEMTINMVAADLPPHQPVSASLFYRNSHFNLEETSLESWTMKPLDSTPQSDSIIITSNGKVIPLDLLANNPVALAGQSLEELLNQISFSQEMYFNDGKDINDENITKLVTESIIDPDNDSYSLKMVGEGDYHYALLESSYIYDGESIPVETYVLPYHFIPDNSPPEVSGIQPQYEDENGTVVNIPKHSGFFYDKGDLDRIQVELNDYSGLALVEIYDEDNQYLGDLSINGETLSLPDNRNLESGNYTLILYDQAYNKTEKVLPLIVDTTPPQSLSDHVPFSSTVSEDCPIRYTYEPENPNNIELDYSSLLQQDPLEYWNLELTSADDGWNEYLENITLLSERHVIKVECKEGIPANQEVSLLLRIQDLSGNLLEQELVFYTPAIVSESDISISGTAPKEKEYTDWSNDLGHHITLARESHNWESLQIEISENDQWRPLQNSPWDGTEDWIESDLSAHQERRYRLIPVNGSGAENRDAILYTESITVGNYLPMVQIDDAALIYRNSIAYLGAQSEIKVQTVDRDGDSLKSIFSLNSNVLDENLQNNLYLDSGVLDSNLLNPLLADTQHYSLSLNIRDNWSVDGQYVQGSRDITDSLSFTYDDKAPEAEFTLLYDNPQYSWSCNKLNVRVDDAGVGTGSVVFMADDENIDTHSFNLYYDNLQELEAALQRIELPEGFYTLRAVITDRLGNVNPSPILVGKIQNDLTPPQLLSVSPVKEAQGSWNIGTPKVPVDILCQDNLSGIARVEYRYYQGDEVLIEGYKTPVRPQESEEDLPLTQTIEDLNLFPGLAALEEGIEYDLKICLVDQGGNTSDWVELPDAVCFNFTPPVLQLEAWDLVQINGHYYSGQSSIALPSIQTGQNTTVHFILLDEQRNFIQNVGSEIQPGSDGFYILEVEAQDAFGHNATLEIPFCLDTTAPYALAIQWKQGQPDALHPGERVLLSLSGEDQGCGIASWQLEIPGEDVSLRVPSGGASRTSFTLPAKISTGTHSLVVQAQDYLGKTSDPITVPLEVNNTGEYILFHQPDYLGSGQRLSMSWDYHGPMDISHYEVQLLGVREEGSSLLFQNEDSQDSLSLNPEDVEELDSCRGLRLLVRPITSGGERRSLFSSSEIVLDRESPVLQLTGPSIIHPENLPVSWMIEDSSPLKSVSLQLESIDENNGVIQYSQIESWQWQDDGREQDLDLIPLMSQDLPDDVSNLRLRLTVCDLAGNRSEILSGPIVIDRSPAPVFTVQDQGEFLNPDKNDLIFLWFWALTDEEAGETGYSYQLSSTGLVDEEAWIEATEQETRDRTIIFSDLSNNPFKDNSQWFLLLKRHNAGGMERILFSDGITIDRSKPEIVSVELLTSAEEPFEDQFFTSQEDINIKVEARDNQSGIKTYQYRAGTWEGGAFRNLQEEQVSENSLIATQLPLLNNAGSLLSYQIHCSNGAEELSLPSYSPSIMYNPAEPVVDRVLLSAAESTLDVQWSVHAMAPVMEQRVLLYKVNGTVKTLLSENPVPSGERSFRYYQEDLQDGIYLVEVQMKDYANHHVSGLSPYCTMDRQRPSLEWLDLSSYIYDQLNLNLQSNEEMQYISLRLDWSGREIYNKEWNLSVPLTHWQEELDLTSLSDWNLLSSEESAELILSVSARDKQGNWSSLIQNQIVFDGSRPVLQEFSLVELLWEGQPIPNPQLVPRSDVVEGITLEATSANSPITGYRWTVCASPDEQPQDWTDYVALENVTYQLNRQNMSLNGLNLSQGQEFYIALAVQNQAGVYSETAWSPLLKASLRAPQFLLECLPETPDLDASVYTLGPAQVVLTPQNAEFPLLKSIARLIPPESSESQILMTGESLPSFNEILDLRTDASFTRLIEFNKNLQGQWILEVTLQDPFDRSTTKRIGFSANQGPVIDIPQDLSCRPGAPLTLRYQQWLSDPQGIARVQLYRQLGEGEELLGEILYQGENPLSITLRQDEGYIPGNDYDFKLKAEDSLGAWSQEAFSVDFINTSQGHLIENERWKETHYLTGPLTIPDGITLTLADETQVLACSGSYYGSDQEIIIEANGALVLEGEALFSTDGKSPGALWKGIHFESPEVIPINRPVPRILEDLQVMNAVRGITVEPGLSLQFNNLLFQDNIIGLHLLSPWVEVNQCSFSGNLHYGIKEEEGNSPIQTENTFLNNGYDTYDIQIILPSQGDSE